MMPNGVECFLEIYKTREDCVFVLMDVFLDEGVEGADVVSGSVLWCKTSLTFAQEILLTEEVLQSAV